MFLLPSAQPVQRVNSRRKSVVAQEPVRWIFGSTPDFGLGNGADVEIEETDEIEEDSSEFDTLLIGLSSNERKSVLKVSAASEAEDLKLFAR